MEKKLRDAFMQKAKEEPFARKMGIKLVEVGDGRAVVEMETRAEDANMLGMTHGGAIFSLMDEAFEISSNSHGTIAVALNMSVTYHKAPEQKTILRAESREIHRSRKTATYEIRVTDSSNDLIASCSALVYRLPKKLPFLEEN